MDNLSIFIDAIQVSLPTYHSLCHKTFCCRLKTVQLYARIYFYLLERQDITLGLCKAFYNGATSLTQRPLKLGLTAVMETPAIGICGTFFKPSSIVHQGIVPGARILMVQCDLYQRHEAGICHLNRMRSFIGFFVAALLS
jgi:hypothetical protein